MLKTGFRATIMAALGASNDLTVQKNLILADCPPIDGMVVPLYRCGVAATIGCDTTIPSGIPGIGAKRLHALVDENKPIDANALVDIVKAAKTGQGLRTIIFIFNIVHLVGAHRCRRLAGQLAIG